MNNSSKSIKNGIEGLFKGIGQSRLIDAIKLEESWQKISSQAAALHTDNVIRSPKEENGILIYVDSPQWAAELSMNQEYYRLCFSEVLGEEIEKLTFLITKDEKYIREKEEHCSKNYNLDSWNPVELNEKELAEVRDMVKEVEDENLREKLFQAIVSDFERKKGNPNSNQP